MVSQPVTEEARTCSGEETVKDPLPEGPQQTLLCEHWGCRSDHAGPQQEGHWPSERSRANMTTLRRVV